MKNTPAPTQATIDRLQQAQRELDHHIMKEKNLTPSTEITINKIIAMEVELSEAYNEGRRFKIWSSKKPDREKLITEYADAFHFLLSLANDLEIRLTPETLGYQQSIIQQQLWQIDLKSSQDPHSLYMRAKRAVDQIYIETVSKVPADAKVSSITAIATYLRMMMEEDQFTFEDLEKAYWQKNQINHQRQKEGY